jgi:cobalt/nickel transport system permease protein
MHIAEGVLSLPVLAGSALVAAGAVWLGLRRLPEDRIPLAGLLCAMFFVASLIHLPVGVGSVHLVLNGLCGIMLGWAAFPVLLVALSLQALLFGFGGITTLGVNTLVMGVPALLCGLVLYSPGALLTPRAAAAWGAAAGAGAIVLGVLLMCTALWLSGGRSYLPLIGGMLLAHLPVMLIEAAVTAVILASVVRVRPQLLQRGEAG